MPGLTPRALDEESRNVGWLILLDADYGNDTYQMESTDRKIKVFTGATGTLAIKLPPLREVPDGAIFTIYLEDHTTSDCTVEEYGDAPVSYSTITLSADADYAVLQKTPIKWVRIESCLGGSTTPA